MLEKSMVSSLRRQCDSIWMMDRWRSVRDKKVRQSEVSRFAEYLARERTAQAENKGESNNMELQLRGEEKPEMPVHGEMRLPLVDTHPCQVNSNNRRHRPGLALCNSTSTSYY